MPTINQLVKYGRKVKRVRKTKRPALAYTLNSVKNKYVKGFSPFKKGVCLKVFIYKPRKPNSANRAACVVRLSNGARVIAYIPGEKHNLQEHSVVLLRGGRPQDLVGVKYKVVRGKFDANPVEARRQARSQYGRKRPQQS